MKCPIFIAGTLAFRGQTEKLELNCLKEECAWWDKTREHCVITTAAYALSSIMFDLMSVEKKMPHAEQFTK